MAEAVQLAGKDWFTEAEAAEYCGLSLRHFRDSYRDFGISPRRFAGRKLYSRADLFQAIAQAPEWQPSTSAANRGTSAGRKAASSSGALSDRLRPVRLRDFAPRKKPS